MTRGRARAALLAALLLLGGCVVTAPPRGPLVVPFSTDPASGVRAVAERARAADVVYLGEVHDNPHHHAAQARILEAILATGARPLLAFEMLSEREQPALDDALAAAETAADGDRRLRWTARGWPDFGMYWPLFELARRHRLPALATDLDPAVTRQIARGGLAALGTEGARLASRLLPDPAREAAIARTIQDAHCGLLPESRLPAMVESWHARNVTIARRIAEGLAPWKAGGLDPQVGGAQVGGARGEPPEGRDVPRAAGPRRPDETTVGTPPLMVVIIGRGHQAAGGVPAQLETLRPGTRQLVVEMLEVASGEEAEDAAREGTGDIVWLAPAVERPDPCAGLRQRLQ